MAKRLFMLVCCGLFLAASACRAQGDGQAGVLEGTLNIVLGNSNGIVVGTDSRQTQYRNGLAKKLFRIDDYSVCSIAGIGFIPVTQLRNWR
jgi:20S proteasome alpha/beta subunit